MDLLFLPPQDLNEFFNPFRSKANRPVVRQNKDKSKRVRSKIVPFYQKHPDVLSEVVLPLANKKNPFFSLRLLNWVITVLAKEDPIVYFLDEEGRRYHVQPETKTICVDVYQSYKRELVRYGKHFFAPFRRHKRVGLRHATNQGVFQTTLGQLNFLRWAWVCGLVDYVRDHNEVLWKKMTRGKKEGLEF